MPRILALTRYQRLGASSRIRFLQFLPELAKRGLDIELNYLLDDTYVSRLYARQRVDFSKIFRSYVRRLRLMTTRSRYDLLWIEKEAFPWVPAAIETGILSGVPYVVDIDDAWFHRYDMNPSATIRRVFGRKIDSLMANSAAVVAGNHYLAERASAAGAKSVMVIPSVVDLDKYPQATQLADLDMDRDEVVIGWIGTPLNVRYLSPLREAFQRVTASGRVKIHIIGAKVPADLIDLPIRSIPWTEATEVEEMKKLAIGIMPLDDAPWERGKCGFKLLQVMAAGRPVVASPVGANLRIVHHGGNGLLASTVDEWSTALRTLIADRALRQRLGTEARRTVEANYSVKAVLGDLASLLRDAATDHASVARRSLPGNVHSFAAKAEPRRGLAADGRIDLVSGSPRAPARLAGSARTVTYGTGSNVRPPVTKV